MKYFLIIFYCIVFSFLASAQEIDSVFREEVSKFTDSLVEIQIKDKIAGATVSVVHHGEIIHLKGYGMADVEQGMAVNPRKHLFRIGSISKMFVWTSIMQLAEDGKLNLADDINQYIDLNIPQNYDQPITIKHLMTHTPGFEDRIIGLFGRDASSVRPLAMILKEQMPDRVYPPGSASAYSNHGTGIAQYIVEQVSGMDFHEYVTKNILIPLEMGNTTFSQPLPEKMSEDLSVGYVYANDSFIAMDFEYVPMYGVGGCTSTAADMANFMIAHLQLGTFKERQILDSATAKLMQSPAFYNHPKVNPMRYGFMDVSQNGVTIFGHGGDTGWFHSFMALYPENDLGVFISYNSQQGGLEYMKFVEYFTDRFFPERVEAIQPSRDAESLKKYAGFYMSNRYPHSTIAKVAKMAISSNVVVTDEGYLKSNFLGMEKEWVPVDDEIFRGKESNEILVFSKNESGQPTRLYVDTLPIFVFEKATGKDNPIFHFIIFALMIVIALLSALVWLINLIFLRSKRDFNRSGNLSPGSKRILVWATLLWLCFLGALIPSIMMDPMALAYEVPTLMKISLVFPILIAVLLIIMAYYVLTTWRSSNVSVINKLYITTLFVVYTGTIWVLNYWNLLGFKY